MGIKGNYKCMALAFPAESEKERAKWNLWWEFLLVRDASMTIFQFMSWFFLNWQTSLIYLFFFSFSPSYSIVSTTLLKIPSNPFNRHITYALVWKFFHIDTKMDLLSKRKKKERDGEVEVLCCCRIDSINVKKYIPIRNPL